MADALDNRVIPGRNQTRTRVMPGNTNPSFTGYTDKVEPKNQYTRNLFKTVHGHNIFEETKERHGRLLRARGEQVYLIRRKIEGDRCACWDPETRMSQRYRCADCFGTGIVDGYTRYISQATDAVDGKIWIAAPLSPKELNLQDYGIDTLQNYNYWTLPTPVINDPERKDTRSYDWIVRFENDGVSEIGRYWIVNVAISYWQENVEMHQAFNTKLADRDEVIYSIDVGDLTTVTGP